MRTLLRALARAGSVTWDYAPAPPELITQWVQRGAKKGDAVIAAHLEAHGVRYFISENRHFLTELAGLPFEVLTDVGGFAGSVGELQSAIPVASDRHRRTTGCSALGAVWETGARASRSGIWGIGFTGQSAANNKPLPYNTDERSRQTGSSRFVRARATCTCPVQRLFRHPFLLWLPSESAKARREQKRENG